MINSSEEYFRKSAQTIASLYKEENKKKIEIIKELILSTVKKDKMILVGGNGGSACDAEHFCAELVVRYKYDRKPIKCISINSNTSILTAASNDFGYENAFKRVVECFAKKDDIVILLSTSGNSPNVLEALRYSNSIGLNSICLLGKDGGAAKGLCKNSIIIDSYETAQIQQAHITILHYLAKEIELFIKDRCN